MKIKYKMFQIYLYKEYFYYFIYFNKITWCVKIIIHGQTKTDIKVQLFIYDLLAGISNSMYFFFTSFDILYCLFFNIARFIYRLYRSCMFISSEKVNGLLNIISLLVATRAHISSALPYCLNI